MMGLSTAKLIGGAIGLLALVAAFLWIKDAFDDRAELRKWQAEVVVATREAAANPKLDVKLVGQQIKLLGESIKQCKGALDSQSAKVAALGMETERLQGLAAEASRKAAERSNKARGVSERLIISSRSSEAAAKPCAPSETLRSAWQ